MIKIINEKIPLRSLRLLNICKKLIYFSQIEHKKYKEFIEIYSLKLAFFMYLNIKAQT
jgi:hypothetical protein